MLRGVQITLTGNSGNRKTKTITTGSFRYLDVNINPLSGGTVTGSGISCPGDCSGQYTPGTNVVLTGTASLGNLFNNWTGCDSPSGHTCTMTMNLNKSVTANFSIVSSYSKIGVFRNGRWYLDTNGNNVWDGCSTDGCYYIGTTGDKPVAGDWNGDGDAEMGVFRNGRWYLDTNGNNIWDGCSTDGCYYIGTTGDKPVAGDW